MKQEKQLEILLNHGSKEQQKFAFNKLKNLAIANADLNILNTLKEAEPKTKLKIMPENITEICNQYMKEISFYNPNSSNLLIEFIKNKNTTNKKEAIKLFPLFEAIHISNQAEKQDSSHNSYDDEIHQFKEITILNKIVKTAITENPNHLRTNHFPHELKLAAGMKLLVDALTERKQVENPFELDEVANFDKYQLPYNTMNHIMKTARQGYPTLIQEDYLNKFNKNSRIKKFAEMFMPLAEIQGIANDLNSKNVNKYTIQTKYGKESEVFSVFEKYHQIFALTSYLSKINQGMYMDYKFWDMINKPTPVAESYAEFVKETYLNKLETTLKK